MTAKDSAWRINPAITAAKHLGVLYRVHGILTSNDSGDFEDEKWTVKIEDM